MMQKTKPLRYLLFGLLFVCVVIGIVSHSYVWLTVLAVCGLILAVLGDVVENSPTRPHEVYNRMHNRHHHPEHDVQA